MAIPGKIIRFLVGLSPPDPPSGRRQSPWTRRGPREAVQVPGSPRVRARGLRQETPQFPVRTLQIVMGIIMNQVFDLWEGTCATVSRMKEVEPMKLTILRTRSCSHVRYQIAVTGSRSMMKATVAGPVLSTMKRAPRFQGIQPLQGARHRERLGVIPYS